MKLRALDQIHVSSVKPDSLRKGEEFEVSDAAGADLLKKHPAKFEQVAGDAAQKAEPAPRNKAESAPANKAAPKRNRKDK